MNKKLFRILLFFPTLVLTSCGYGLKQIYDGNLYNSPIWENNYYRVYDNDMKEYPNVYKDITDNDLPFISFNDVNFKLEEPNVSISDIYSEESNSYGMSNALRNVDESFKEGYPSKLFDGKLFCFGRYETVRVQIDESGFGTMFKKEMVSADYFFMHFKSELDFKSHGEIPGHRSDIELHIGLVYRNDTGYNKVTYKYVLNNVNTNVSDFSDYVAFGFSMRNINTNRICGMTIDYKLLYEEYNENMGVNYDHALFLYEVMFPRSTWR